MQIARQKVDSSTIADVGYDATSKTLSVQFKSGGVYHYQDVPADVHQQLMSADSVGSTFAQKVKGTYEFTKQ